MNILIKLMSIVSLVIAPTLASMSGNDTASNAIKHEAVKKVAIINQAGDKTLTAAMPSINAGTEKLVNALLDDNLIQKDNYTVSLKKGRLSINGVDQDAAIISKYQGLLTELQGSDLEISNSNN